MKKLFALFTLCLLLTACGDVSDTPDRVSVTIPPKANILKDHYATLEPTSEPTSEPTFEPTIEPTIEPTFEPTPEPTPEPTLEPTPEPTPEPRDDLPAQELRELAGHPFAVNINEVYTIIDMTTDPVINFENGYEADHYMEVTYILRGVKQDNSPTYEVALYTGEVSKLVPDGTTINFNCPHGDTIPYVDLDTYLRSTSCCAYKSDEENTIYVKQNDEGAPVGSIFNVVLRTPKLDISSVQTLTVPSMYDMLLYSYVTYTASFYGNDKPQNVIDAQDNMSAMWSVAVNDPLIYRFEYDMFDVLSGFPVQPSSKADPHAMDTHVMDTGAFGSSTFKTQYDWRIDTYETMRTALRPDRQVDIEKFKELVGNPVFTYTVEWGKEPHYMHYRAPF